ncbi:MAG: protein phosphatase 2C domain-containing protein [Pseudomonadota bacterium]|nr:protein phosphatase 2C domain-containing protein [Pseudomonadota bacterium]
MRKLAARTDPGKKRNHNEDALLTLPESGIYVVADGVGGRACGEVASAICVESFRDGADLMGLRLSAYAENPTLDTRNAVLATMDEVLQIASRRIYETAEAEGRAGMTTTVVALVVGNGTAFLAHVGDSRAYLVRDGELRQLTEDHSMVNELVRTGKMTYEEARSSRHRHVITRAVGLYPTVQPSLAAVDLHPGDRLLLCSDGLSDVVAPELMLEEGASDDLDGAVEALLQAALDRGGPDNITVVLLDPDGTDRGDEMAARAGMLETMFLFEDLPYAARLQVGRIVEEHYFAPGEVLVEQGSPGTSMYVILEGEVSVQVNGIEVARLSGGEHFGELSLADDEPRSASVAGVSFGSAISVSSEQLRDFCRREPELGNELLWKMMRALGQRLRRTNARIADSVTL